MCTKKKGNNEVFLRSQRLIHKHMFHRRNTHRIKKSVRSVTPIYHNQERFLLFLSIIKIIRIKNGPGNSNYVYTVEMEQRQAIQFASAIEHREYFAEENEYIEKLKFRTGNHFQLRSHYSSNEKSLDQPEIVIPKNPLESYQTAHLQPDNGSVYDKKPFKLRLEAGKRYSWCLCGKSKNQPICDGTHKNAFLKIKLRLGTSLRYVER